MATGAIDMRSYEPHGPSWHRCIRTSGRWRRTYDQLDKQVEKTVNPDSVGDTGWAYSKNRHEQIFVCILYHQAQGNGRGTLPNQPVHNRVHGGGCGGPHTQVGGNVPVHPTELKGRRIRLVARRSSIERVAVCRGEPAEFWRVWRRLGRKFENVVPALGSSRVGWCTGLQFLAGGGNSPPRLRGIWILTAYARDR